MSFVSAATPASANGTLVSINKPAGAASGHICILTVTCDIEATTCSTPTGFTPFTDVGQNAPDSQHNYCFWRKLDGTEGATFTATLGSATDWLAECAIWSGRHATDPPVAVVTTPNTASNASPVSVALDGVTALAGDDLVWIGLLDGNVVAWTFTPPAAFTEASDAAAGFCAASMAYRNNVAAGATGTLTGTATGAGGTAGFTGYVIRIPVGVGGSPAGLFSPTPSGTVAGTTTANIGASTDQTTGTAYCVVDTAANLTGVSIAQIKAGQRASGAAALAAGNVAVSASPFSIGVTGLSPNTLYSYAIVQNNANGDSNVVTGTFTTAALAIPSITDAGDEVFEPAEAGIVISGTNFGASQGAGAVYLSPTNNVNDVNRVAQTVTSWSNTSIQFTCVRGSLAFLTQMYLFVVSDTAASNTQGYSVQVEPRVYVRDDFITLSSNPRANETGLRVLVWRALPTGQAPDQVLENQTLDASGNSNWKIARGTLTVGSPIWFGIVKDGTPAIATLRKFTPTYE